MQKITPFLWFDGNAEQALSYYLSIFPNSKVHSQNRMGDGGSLLVGTIELEGQQFMLLNGGPHYAFTPAISFVIDCETQEEVDYYWDRLSEGGSTQPCGWLQDKFGLSWQVVPRALGELMGDPDPDKAGRVMQAMMQMVKLDIAGLRLAYDGD